MRNGSPRMKLISFLCSLMLFIVPATSFAQSPYSAAVTINGNGITYFEIEQRAMMLEILGSADDPEKQALSDLIDDRLRLYASRNLGLTLSDEELQAGLTEFAARANLTAEQFVEELGKAGVAKETFADFVGSGLLWRKVVGTRFQSKAFVTEAELDTAVALGTTATGVSVLMSELIVPYQDGTQDQALELVEFLSKNIKSFKEFEEAALTYSAAPSRANGGKLDWIPIANLPPVVGSKVMTMGVGSVTAPVILPTAVVIFQLRGLRDNKAVAARPIAYDYATLLLPGGRSAETLAKAHALRGSVDTCMDLMAKSEDYPEGSFNQQVVPLRSVTKDIGGELANLDANEVSYNLTRGENGENLLFLMLCGRTNKISEGNREDVRNALFIQRMEAFGNGYLQELKGDAIIVYK